ncbi:putative autophagy protein Atg13 [Talaromyces proteolyticus]|uniref:Autophagy-related protein 13 n=1 Tax=Talaromyces proteolyticus TaxID=1131652 RepID=A0AAD4Q631_9EURO|nr:putative autophagy protein Atg13 [Talaromyces proteolyticus]KAH8704952.1 putative autophagy protein Atg13 [Talaromyces proteolyticus]
MHQHPRSPMPARQPGQRLSGLARDDVPRDQDDDRPPSGAALDTTRGLGIDPGAEAAAPGKEAMARLNQIISNYHTKAALIILQARADLPPVFSKGSDTPRVNRWFNVDLDETDEYRESIRKWKTCDATDNRPLPMVIETYLDAKSLTNSQTLVLIDNNGKRWDVLEALAASQDTVIKSRPKEVVLERWRVELGQSVTRPPPDLSAILPAVYKKSIVLFRSLHAYAKFLPTWKIVKRAGIMRSNPALEVKYRIREARDEDQTLGFDNLTLPLQTGNEKVVETYSFGTTDSPAGPFSIQVTYRSNVDFRVDDSESLLSSRFMGADDTYFLPSLPSEESNKLAAQEPGSLPVRRKGMENPDRSQAYGSLSTFHQVGPTTGASPISTLRAARDLVGTSPSSASPPPRLLPAAKIGSGSRTAAIANESSSSMARRPSVSFNPFKAPPLSASPSLVDPPLGASPRAATARTASGNPSDPRAMLPPTVPASAGRASAAEQIISSSASSSPRPGPTSKYSSSFSHRRGRLSSGGNARIDEDNTSSGKASATSSSAQPGSGILAEPTGTSGESLHTDDENISDFLKMLDMRKDLLNPVRAAAVDAATRRTSAALTRFQRMRDSNAALSDSMSSSLLLQRSSASSSRQLSSVPAMVAGTSISTASSPGKPISPHTPHTPAIPSRLSSNSIVNYNDREGDSPLRQPDAEQDSQPEESTSYDTTHRSTRPGANAIDIPKSPRPLGPSYRRSSSAAQNRRISTGGGTDEEEIFPFALRSVSLGAEDRTNLSLSTRLRQQDNENIGAGGTGQQDAETAPPADEANNNALRDFSSQRGGYGASAASSNHPYQTHLSHSRGRGSSGAPPSNGSASGSLSRGSAIPSHLSERERERDTSASGSNSGNSFTDIRRGTGHRSGSGRSTAQHATAYEEDEPLLFTMSDFGASRRSLEEGRRGSVGGESSATSGGSRRGSGRRNPGTTGFHAWQ